MPLASRRWGQVWVVRVGEDDGELLLWHFISVYNIESRLIMRVRYGSQIRIQISLDWLAVSGIGVGGLGLGLWVWGLGFRVQGSGFRVQGSGFRVQSSGLRA